MRVWKTLQIRWNGFVEHLSIQFGGVCLVEFIFACLLLLGTLAIPPACYAQLGEVSLSVFVALMLLCFLIAGTGGAWLYGRICGGMFSEGKATSEKLADDLKVQKFLLWVLTAMFGAFGLGTGAIPGAVVGENYKVILFLLTGMFFAFTLSVEYVYQFRLPKINAHEKPQHSGSKRSSE